MIVLHSVTQSTHLDTPIIITRGQEVVSYYLHAVNWGTKNHTKNGPQICEYSRLLISSTLVFMHGYNYYLLYFDYPRYSTSNILGARGFSLHGFWSRFKGEKLNDKMVAMDDL